MLPVKLLLTEAGELTELGRAYSTPRDLKEALCVVCPVAGQWNDPAEADKMAMDILIVIHHPSIGMSVNKHMTWATLLRWKPLPECSSAHMVSNISLFSFPVDSGSSARPLANRSVLHEHQCC